MSVLTIWLDGKPYEVSEKFSVAVQKALGTMRFNMRDVETERDALLTLSNNHGLGDQKYTRLEYLTHVKNVANAIRVVGAHHDPVKEWGLDGWDAVHGNAHHQECGCIKHFVFDHHSATNHFGHNRVSAERKHHEIEPLWVCVAHGGVEVVDHSGAEEDWARFEARES